MMYVYIVERTQIYLSRAQAAALDREAGRRGTTRSHLIREAIEVRYGTDPDDELDRVALILSQTFGMWSDRTETAVEYVDRLRTGNSLHALYGDTSDSVAGHDDPD